MRMSRWGASLVAVGAVMAPSATAILVAPDSPCSTYCGNVLTSDSVTDMTCVQSAYGSNGAVFEQCINCEISSVYASGNMTDLAAMLYNLRYAAAYCVFAYGGTPDGGLYNGPCFTYYGCGALQDAFEYANLSTNVGPYDYCNTWDSTAAGRCELCLQAATNGAFFSNFITILDAACAQEPPAGALVAVTGSPFSTSAMTITTPSPTASALALPDYGPVSLGARVGIAFGALALILAVAGFCIVTLGKRRRRRFLRELEHRYAAQPGMVQGGSLGWPQPPREPYGTDGRAPGGGGMHMGGGVALYSDTPLSQKPLRGGWNDSPVSAVTESTLPRYLGNSPFSAASATTPQDGLGAAWPPRKAIGVAVSDEAGAKGKNKEEEVYEMHEVESPNSGGATVTATTAYPGDYDMPAVTDAHRQGLGRQHSARQGSRGRSELEGMI